MTKKYILLSFFVLFVFAKSVAVQEFEYQNHDPLIRNRLIEMLHCDYPNIQLVQRILYYYPMIPRKDKQAQLLLLCLQNDHLEILSLFLSSGAAQHVPANGYLLLHTAIVNGTDVIGVEWLLRAGALQGNKIIYCSLLELLEKKYAQQRLKNDWQVYSLLKREIAAK